MNNDGPKEKKMPEQAKGNPVYEQTPEDMPLWCCGKNCGRNSRLTVFVLSIFGIACSIFLCLSHDYFKFTAIRNDTFTDIDKKQPSPFEYATVAKVGLFWYQIEEVFVYPWPPPRERMLFREMLDDEVRRLQTVTTPTLSASPSSSPSLSASPSLTPSVPTVSLSPSGTPTGSSRPSGSSAPSSVPSTSSAPTTSFAPSTSGQPSFVPSDLPSMVPTISGQPSFCVPPLEAGAAIDCLLGSNPPTMNPTSAPTITNPNDIVAASTQLGVRLKYPHAMDQFDTVFYNAQVGAIMAPIFCALAFFTGLVEYCCCLFKCSWLPTAIFLTLAFIFQILTVFLFLSPDFCEYEQECRFGAAGYLNCLAILLYFICQMLICCTPRPNPLFNFMKPKPKRVKKRSNDDGYDDDMYYDDDQYYDEFGNEENYDGEKYHDDGTHDQSQYDDNTYDYTQNTGGGTRPGRRAMGTVPEDGSYYEDDGTYGGQSRYDDDGTYNSQSFRTYDQQQQQQQGDGYGGDGQQYDDGTQYYDDGTTQYDDGTRYDDGTQYDDGTRYDDGTQYDDGTRYYDDGTQYDDGTRYDDGTQYDDRTYGDQSRFDRGTYNNQSVRSYGDGTYADDTQYDDDGYTQGDYSRGS